MSGPINKLLRGIKNSSRVFRSLQKSDSDYGDYESEFQVLRIQGRQLVKFSEDRRIASIRPFTHVADAAEILPEQVGEYLKSLDFSSLTSVQKICIPLAAAGYSFAAVAPTGTGKTYAFLIPTITRLTKLIDSDLDAKALVLAPTKELANQIFRDTSMLLKHQNSLKCCSILKSKPNVIASSHILVSTPGIGYVVDSAHLKNVLRSVRIIIFDEMDALLESGFAPQSDAILGSCTHEEKQILMFSASLPARVMELVMSTIPLAPVIRIGTTTAVPKTIQQELIKVNTEVQKLAALRQMIEDKTLAPPAMIFVQDAFRAESLVRVIAGLGMKCAALHSNISSALRQKIVDNFSVGELWCIVATDVVSRGLDCKDVKVVVNYDLPTSRESYLHRVGRTGRGKVSGRAITLYTADDVKYIRVVTSVMKESGCVIPPDLKSAAPIDTKRLLKLEISRRPITYQSDEERRRESILRKKRKSIKRARNKLDV